MKKLLSLLALFAVMLCLSFTPAQAKSTYSNPYNGILFSGIPCFDNNIGTTWNIMGAAYQFEAGGLTIADGAQQAGCDYWTQNNVVRFSTYSAVDQQCLKVTGPILADPAGGYWWNGNVHVQMNTNYPQCQDTLQNRNNRISQAIGYALGLVIYTYPGEHCIMNRTYEELYNFAGDCDRARIAVKY